jgi:hypothetical protein
MSLYFACVLFEDGTVSDEALSVGFGVSCAGFDVDTARLTVGSIPGLAGWSVAFYRSGKTHPAFEELDHTAQLFEDELPPGMSVLDHATRSEGRTPTRVYSIVYSEEDLLDDACRFDAQGFHRCYLRDGDDGPVVGKSSGDTEEVLEISDAEAEGPHEGRGSAFLSRELGTNVLIALSQALFLADRVVPVSLAVGSPAAVALLTKRLNASLHRQDGRGRPSEQELERLPESLRAFAEHYDWADPSDPGDIYRELSIGRLKGNFTFLRSKDWPKSSGQESGFPLGTLSSSALGGSKKPLATPGVFLVPSTGFLLDAEGKRLGPTFAELLLYLALGFKTRDDVEEDQIQALMLRAEVRVS